MKSVHIRHCKYPSRSLQFREGYSQCVLHLPNSRAVARALIGGGGCIFIYSASARLISFEMKLISKEVSRAELEYMNIHPPPPQLAF